MIWWFQSSCLLARNFASTGIFGHTGARDLKAGAGLRCYVVYRPIQIKPAAGSIAFVVQFCGAYVRLWCRKIKNIQTWRWTLHHKLASQAAQLHHNSWRVDFCAWFLCLIFCLRELWCSCAACAELWCSCAACAVLWCSSAHVCSILVSNNGVFIWMLIVSHPDVG